MIVAIDTSGAMSGIALMTDNGTLLAEQSWHSNRRHSEQVLAQLDALCRLVECNPAHITHIAVSIGPGSWSGIRIGISIAKGIAIANNAVIVGINALDLLAWPLRNRAPVTACIPLGRGRFATAIYPQHAWAIGSITPINQTIGDITVDTQHVLVYEPLTTSQLSPSMINHGHQHSAWPHPRILAELGLQVFHTYPTGHPVVEPIYLGEPVHPKP
ncbi:MAG: tRNA (adenosine(37)-N6)-threonylcarbamoyltransferase complex dimerization subunit type 1 TsaB [Roseiflexaceae bacterium]|jgi:tRNA threonylcarbamoyladenosine biosynthesis protein TsaB